MDLASACRLMYRGYLYSLVLLAASIVLLVSAVFVEFSNPASPYLGVLAFAALPLGAAGFAVVLLIHRGFMALSRLGVRWAGVQARLLTALFVVELSLLALGLLRRERPLLQDLPQDAALAIVLAVLGLVWGLALAYLATHLLYLKHMYRHTGVLRFHTAYVVTLVGVAFLVPVVTAPLGLLILFAAHVVEMLAYREASRGGSP
ncbi:hypothetical protein [Pyrobaculum sp.]|uniref:hypothetical protein n=1 Tax=Pyrobaculum sp. TaxID=2004705 RepID=UPI003D114AC7